MKMTVERVPIDSVSFDPANVRKYSEKNLGAIKATREAANANA